MLEVQVIKLVIEPHHNADALEIARVGDYQSIVRKGQFKTGDLAAYIPEQSLLPPELVERMGLVGKLAGANKNRVKAVKLRGVLSQGLCLEADPSWVEGQDVAELLGITKWEPDIHPELAGNVWYATRTRTLTYDIRNIKAFPNALVEGESVVIGEKVHGCLDGETLLETLERGPVSISEIVQSKTPYHVRSYDHMHDEEVYALITNFSETPDSGDWYEVELEDGTKIVLTGNHPVYLPELKCYRRAEDLQVGDEVLKSL